MKREREKLFLMQTEDKDRRVYMIYVHEAIARRFYSQSIFDRFSRRAVSTTARCVYRSSVSYTSDREFRPRNARVWRLIVQRDLPKS